LTIKVLPWHESQVTSEDEKLQDTATAINTVPRQPTEESFIPIGHISLDSKNVEAEHIDLDLPSKNVFWIKTFYIRQHIQGQGIGRAAMDEVESMAVREPLQAKTLMLDTVQKDDQKREEFANATYGGIPKVSELLKFEIFDQVTHYMQTTNEEWYSRRGYRLIKTMQNYYRVADKNGKVWDTKTVFMRKDIAVLHDE
jgi:GNAT superfamily N-acetyltransferase